MSRSLLLPVRVTPRSSRDAVEGLDGEGAIRVRVTAPPADGAANDAVVRLMAAELGVPRRAVSLATGASARRKRLRVEGVDAASIRRRWPGVALGGD